MRRLAPLALILLLGCPPRAPEPAPAAAHPEAVPPTPSHGAARPADGAAMDDAAQERAERYDALLKEGARLEGEGKTAGALAAYERAKALAPGELRAYHAIRTVHENEDRYDLARAEIDRAVAAMPDDESRARATLELGSHLSKQERQEEAVAALDKAIALNPAEHEFYLEKGTVLNKMGRHEEAIVQFKRALERDPRCELAHANLGSTYHLLGRDDLAEPMMRRAAELRPHDPGYWRLLADFYGKRGEEDKRRAALAEMEKAAGGG